MIGHKINLSKFKKTEIMTIIFSDHCGVKLEINNKNKVISTHIWNTTIQSKQKFNKILKDQDN